MQNKKYFYFFSANETEGSSKMKNVLGGKGANLAEMTSLGIPVPPGFTISADICDYYYKNNRTYPADFDEKIEENLKKLENAMNKKFGDDNDPLLVSVRSGAAVSMPGMMDTVLNLGLNDVAVVGLAKKTGNERFAWDAYRRFMQMFGDVVMGIEHKHFEEVLDKVKAEKNVTNDTDLNVEDLKEVVKGYKELYITEGKEFPQEPKIQLRHSIDAVFGSWNNPRAIKYRVINKMPTDLLGTAVNVQSMVFGNMGSNSGTGVAFSRDPSTGENKYFYGEYLIDAQGEDVVAGIRTPQQMTIAGSREWAEREGISEDVRKNQYPSLEEAMPECFKQLDNIKNNLEKHYKDMQDMEFTIEQGELFMLQTRTGKRTAAAHVKIAVDMHNEGFIDKETAIMRVPPEAIDQLLHPVFDGDALDKATELALGLPASPGAATGKVVFTAEKAEELAAEGEKVILVRNETSPEDVGGMDAAQGILTARGGMTSHAAVVARGWGKCCVAGCGSLRINEDAGQFEVAGHTVKEGDYISLNGSNGKVYLGKVDTKHPDLSGDFEVLMKWADSLRTLGVRTNADSPKDSDVARNFGAEGIGLTRTEHMFFEGDRIDTFRQMILADDLAGREKALDKLELIQKDDFKGIFYAMRGLPVTVRLLDPPLHEFLPHEDDQVAELAYKINKHPDRIKEKVASLSEFNPMLGHRGCRLAVTYPEIAKMQTRAIIGAAIELYKEKGADNCASVEIMVPLIGHVNEFTMLKQIIVNVADDMIKEANVDLKYMVGTMIEIPRAALTADEIAVEAEFFSFGTNDLTQMTFGYSRDDAGVFLPEYVNKKILPGDPFQSVDQTGVGRLMKIACKEGRSVRKNIKLGICGEHGGEPKSIDFCHRIGLNYVSCSPFRVPIARLAAAQAAIVNKDVEKKNNNVNEKEATA